MVKIKKSIVISLLSFLLCIINYAQGSITGDVKKGEMIAIQGDCQACHSYKQDNGESFAGGYPIASPLGVIYSSNITPSKTQGIGNYSLEEFSKAVRSGIRADGKALYPAMPYPAYTQMSDEDIKDLYAYLMTVNPVDEPIKSKTDLAFPFNIRRMMHVWNTFYLDRQSYQDNPQKNAQWNRGAYLVEGLTHCGTCHTPRDFLMGEQSSQFLGGAQMGQWYAPNITPSETGIGNWSEQEIVTYLKTGRVKGKAQAAGPMAEAVENSFQYMTDQDLQAIAVYLQTVKPIQTAGQKAARDSFGKAFEIGEQSYDAQDNDNPNDGQSLFATYCAGCHQSNGGGAEDQVFPALFHNTSTGDINPSNLIAVILNGVQREVADDVVWMPNFGEDSPLQSLDDEQIAELAQFVYEQYGHPDVKITAAQVKELRQGGPLPLLTKLQPFILPAIIIVIMMMSFWLWYYIRRAKRQ